MFNKIGLAKINTDRGGLNIKVEGVDAVSPIHYVVLYAVEGNTWIAGCMAYWV
jgi:hypothetical protein